MSAENDALRSTLTVELIAQMWRDHAACTWRSDGTNVRWTCGIIHPGPIHMQPTTRDRHFAALVITQVEAEPRPSVSARRTDWGIRDDTTGNVGTVGAYNRAATEEWLAELTEPSTLMRRERTTYEDDVTEWVSVDGLDVVMPPGQQP